MIDCSPSFVHLRLKSEFSVSNSTIRLKEALGFAKRDCQVALALTDSDNLFGAVSFYDEARRVGIKPIIGCDVNLESERDGNSNALILVRNWEGYKSLCRLLTLSWLKNRANDMAAVKKEWLVGPDTHNFILLSGGANGDIGKAILDGEFSEAVRLTSSWVKMFPGRFFLELQRHSTTPEQVNESLINLSKMLGVPVVATHPIQFLGETDFFLHEVKSCIFDGSIVSDRKRQRKFGWDQYFKSQAEMGELFSDIPIALSNTIRIAQKCNLELSFGKGRTPPFPLTPGCTLKEHFLKALIGKLGDRIRRGGLVVEKHGCYTKYKIRLLSEYRVVSNMSFLEYFLVVSDFVRWSKRKDIAVGPGRGSGAGSLIVFVLGITDIEPLQYGLLFERFLNPNRVSMPDLDIDFCQERRDQVIYYVREKYGAAFVSQITTFGTLTTKAAIRNIGRALNLNYSLVDSVAKLIPERPNHPITITEALKKEPLLLQKCEEDCGVRQLINYATKMEGLTRNVAVHAGGVLITPLAITNFCPLYSQSDAFSMMVSQLDKDGIERIGLTKFDFLGLTALTVVSVTIEHIKRLNCLDGLVLKNISSKDPRTFKLLQQANTIAVFQLEGLGMRGMLRIARPDNIGEVIALIALYRPGPIKLIHSFFKRKYGLEEVTYPSILLQPILEETFGVMVYQEQVMQIAQTIGGYTLTEADLLRRAISKKQTTEMHKHRALFNSRTKLLGIDHLQSDAIFQLMEKFACYGFNKSHAAAYASLSYQTAWLKAHFPVSFIAANFSYSMSDFDRIKALYQDCRKGGVCLLQPDINTSLFQFEPLEEQQKADQIGIISYGLGAIRGCSKNAVKEIIRVREDRPFNGILDFCFRANRRVVSRRLIESLIKAGAFDNLHGFKYRSSLLGLIPSIIRYSFNLKVSKSRDILPFVRIGPAKMIELIAKATPILTKRKILKEEKRALGFYLTEHPFKYFRRELFQVFKTDINTIKSDAQHKSTGTICGIVTTIVPQSFRGKPAVRIVIEDGRDQCQALIRNDLLDWKLSKDQLVVITGEVRVTLNREASNLTATSIMSLGQVRDQFCHSILVWVGGSKDITKARALLQSQINLGGRPLVVKIGIRGVQIVSCLYYFNCSLAKIVLGLKRRVNVLRVLYSYPDSLELGN
ncbi:DNA polymerase III subunit alpha [Candidatus Tremblaya phenacola PAVE]|nr:DNA polymerase III subunit alpha [Candidatus Tremblaya phenacola PAVE]